MDRTVQWKDDTTTCMVIHGVFLLLKMSDFLKYSYKLISNILLRSDGRHGYEWAKIGDFINLTFYLTLELAKNSVLKLKFILFYFNLMILGVFCGI